jgi:hypothetical protein
VVGGSQKVVIAHSTATGEVLWLKGIPGDVEALCVHGNIVVAPADNSNTVVLDVTTGHQLHTWPSAGKARGVCVFDGLTSDVICFDTFLTAC